MPQLREGTSGTRESYHGSGHEDPKWLRITGFESKGVPRWAHRTHWAPTDPEGSPVGDVSQ